MSYVGLSSRSRGAGITPLDSDDNDPALETQPPIRTVYVSTMALLKALNVPMAHEVVTCLVAHRTNLHRRRSQNDLSKDAKAALRTDIRYDK